MTGIEDCQPIGEGYTWTGNVDWAQEHSVTAMWWIPDSTCTLEWPQGIAAWQIGSLGNIYFEGENAMEEQLVDLVLALGLDKDHVSEIREIVGHSDWRERFMLYMLARAVLEGGVEAEALGYERKEK